MRLFWSLRFAPVRPSFFQRYTCRANLVTHPFAPLSIPFCASQAIWSADNCPRRSSHASKVLKQHVLPILRLVEAPGSSPSRLHLFESFRGTVPLRPVQHPWQIHAVKRSPGGPDVDVYIQASICAACPNVTYCGSRLRALCGDATSLHLTKYLVLVECAIYFIFRKEPRHSTESAPSMERSCQVLHLLGTCCH